MQSDEQLVEAAQAGDREAFGELYDRHVAAIFRFAFARSRRKAIAEDVTSMVFMRALEKIRTFSSRGEHTFRAWLFTLARNVIIDEARKATHVSQLDDRIDVPETISSARRAEASAELSRILDLLNAFSETQRDVVILRVWHDLPYSEIARIVGKNEKNCKVIFSRTITDLRTKLPLATFVYLLMHL